MVLSWQIVVGERFSTKAMKPMRQNNELWKRIGNSDYVSISCSLTKSYTCICCLVEWNLYFLLKSETCYVRGLCSLYWMTHHLIITPFTISEMPCYKEKKKGIALCFSTEVVSWKKEFEGYLNISHLVAVLKIQALLLCGYNSKSFNTVPGKGSSEIFAEWSDMYWNLSYSMGKLK